jgi:phosphoglycolate phosphatase
LTQPSTLVLFDIDGTLLRADGCGRASIAEAMRQVFGRTGDYEHYQFAGKTDWQILSELLGRSAAQMAARIPEFERAAARHLERIISRHDVCPCPGAIELIDALAQSPAAVLGLLTGNLRATAPIKLRAAGFDPAAFRLGAYGSEAPRRDTLPSIAVKRARALTGVSFAGERVVIVGDTVADVTCGRGIGARSIAVLTGAGSRQALEAHHPDHLFDDLSDLEAVLAAIFAFD